ncbi:hypothetical protein SAMN05421841_1081 [Chryseobacterium wanjuense]|uniref:NlpE N-terminal domain-containing protein n=1 Tax=Chryseobacterium wanjuense TaxID=356305 RepID=A0A1I0PA67_9FLAO|nr:hypothetical protein [Chryseobacterium wanjuense]SEW11016.1 hypothetical protein SAMN05421841_1081 [Chryseobacterium wanjuense]
MKHLLLLTILGLTALTVTACKQPGKVKAFTAENSVNTDNIVKSVYTDDEFGESDMEVTINHSKNTATIHLEGQTYQLKKSNDLPNYTAENDEYRYTDINGEITLLRKDFDMVVFHHEREPDGQKTSKMSLY